MSISDDFDILTAESVEEFVQRQQEEHLHLDFKLLGSAELSGRDDRRSFAKALSGFANSDGGVIVWGVDARPNADGIDCAVSKRPVQPVAKLISRLNQLTGDAVSPSVDGVRHRALPMAGSEAGFAATLVPVSDSGPHQAKLGENRYFKRSGDSFMCMEHFDLEDMFGRRQRPVLGITWKVIRGSDAGLAGEYWSHSVVLGIGNSGRGAARAPMLAIEPQGAWFRRAAGLDGNSKEGLEHLPRTAGSTWHRYGGPATQVIHCGTELDVCAITCRLRAPDADPSPLELHYQLAAENVRLVDTTLEIPVDDLVRYETG